MLQHPGARRVLTGSIALVAATALGPTGSALATDPLVPPGGGTVVGWGRNDLGQLNVPAGLSGVTAITAGQYHNLAVKSDGTVVAWGLNRDDLLAHGATYVPAGLSGVTAVAAGFYHSLALKSDGTVVEWGDYDRAARGFPDVNPPAGLSGVTAIAAGAWVSLALKSDGTVVAGTLRRDPAAHVHVTDP